MTRSASRKDKLETKLRFGWTTGTCATAAVNAAYTAMLAGQFPDRVTSVTPSGKNADLEVAETDESAAARLSTTLQDQNAPRRTIELANWLARL